MSDDFKKGKNFEQKESYSHDNIFHSILGAFGVKTKLYDKNLDIFPVGIRQTKMTSTKKQKKKLFEI